LTGLGGSKVVEFGHIIGKLIWRWEKKTRRGL